MPKYFHCHVLKDGREVIVHTGHPAFVAEVRSHKDGLVDIMPVHWFERLPADVMVIAAVLRRIGDWYDSQINKG